MNTTVKSTLILTTTAAIWGFAFVAQRTGMDHVGPFVFNGTRLVLGALTVYLTICLLERRAAPLITGDGPWYTNVTLRGGLATGLALFLGSICQQIGMVYTTASKGGFLTTLYIVLVPLAGLFLRHRVYWNTWLAVGLAGVGLYLLTVTEQLTIEAGDLWVLAGALFWTCHILTVDHFAQKVDAFRMCTIQFLTAAGLCLVMMPFFDHLIVAGAPGQVLSELWAAAPQIAYVGILSSGVAFTAQVFGQRGAPPTLASLVMSLEAVFATVGGFLLLGERFTLREAGGCLLMFAAIILAQLPFGRRDAAPPTDAPPEPEPASGSLEVAAES